MDDRRGGKIVVELNGRLNKCGVISPRYDVSVGDMEAWTARLLPSRQVRMRERGEGERLEGIGQNMVDMFSSEEDDARGDWGWRYKDRVSVE